MLLWLKFLLTWNIGKLKPKNGGPLPEPPHSEDPTQWLFQGNVKDSEAPPLHVAVARLLGYRWPEQPPQSDPLTPPLADPDGIVTIPPVMGKLPAAPPACAIFGGSYGSDWSLALEESLLDQVGYRRLGLEAWLRDGFFLANILGCFITGPLSGTFGRSPRRLRGLNKLPRAGPGQTGKLIYTYLGIGSLVKRR